MNVEEEIQDNKLAQAIEQRGFRRGVEAMRDAAFKPVSHKERIARMDLWQHLQDAAARLLEERKR